MTSIGSTGGMMPPMMRGREPPAFGKIDGDSDGSLTLDELTAAGPSQQSGDTAKAEALFKAMDADSDGAVSEQEFDDFGTRMREAMSALQFMAQIQGQGEAPPPPDADEMFATLDGDGNGSVSQAEFSDAARADGAGDGDMDAVAALFDAIDADDDGAVSQDENQAFADRQGGAGGPPPPPPGGSSGTSARGDTSAIIAALMATATNAYASTGALTSDATPTLLAALEAG